jgi:hypothetical protein
LSPSTNVIQNKAEVRTQISEYTRKHHNQATGQILASGVDSKYA